MCLLPLRDSPRRLLLNTPSCAAVGLRKHTLHGDTHYSAAACMLHKAAEARHQHAHHPSLTMAGHACITDRMLQNIKLVENVKKLAAKKNVTAGQMALAWLHHQVLQKTTHASCPGALCMFCIGAYLPTCLPWVCNEPFLGPVLSFNQLHAVVKSKTSMRPV